MSSNRILWNVTATRARRAATACAGRWVSAGFPAAVVGSAKGSCWTSGGCTPSATSPLDEAALIEPLSVAHHAVARSGAKSGDVALAGGSGPIGLLTAAVLKGMGVTTIISELTRVRKERAVSSGVADHVLDPSQEDVPARVLELAAAPAPTSRSNALPGVCGPRQRCGLGGSGAHGAG